MLPALLRNYFGPTAGAGQKAVEPRTSSRMRFRISNPDASSDDGDDDDDDYDGDDHDNDDASSTVSYAAPVYRLPPQALVRIFGYLVEAGRSASGGGFNGSDGADEGSGYGYGSSNASAAKTVTKTSLVAVLLACRPWLESGIPALYANPPLHTAHAFAGLVRVLAQSAAPDSATYFEYHPLVEALDISGSAADAVEMGDIETVLGLASGSLVSFRLAGCLHVSSKIIQSLADFVPSLAHLDLAGCPVGDGYMGDLVRGCPGLRTLDLSGTNVTLRASLELLLCGLRAVKAARFEGLGQGDDTDADTQNDYVRPNATPTSTPRSRRSSFVPSATVTATAKTIISSARGPTALALTSASFSGASLSLKDMKVIASRAPNITHLSFLACDSLSDAHISTYLDALLLSSSNVPPSSVQKQLPQGYATPRLESLDLDGCEELTSVSVIALSEAFAGVRKLGQVSAPRHDAPTNMLDLLDGRTGRLKFLTVSSLRVVGLGGTQVGGEAVRVLVRECGALEEVRLDRCEILVHTYLEVVGIECWMQLQEEKEQRKRRQSLILSKKNNSGVARKESTLSIGSNSGGGSSRLPVPVKKLVVNSSVGMGINMTTPPASPMYGTSALLTGGKRGMPEGWLRLIGEAALKKVSDYEGSF